MAGHWRLLVGVGVGLAFWLGLSFLGVTASVRALAAWNAGAVAYLVLAWWLFLTAKEADVRRRAARNDETRGVILLLVIAATTVSLAGIVAVLVSVKGGAPQAKSLVLGLAAATLVSSWALLQSVFVAHYAHRHFQLLEERGAGGGFLFPGDPPRTYLDFAYLAICVGATAQISDPSVQSTPLRNLVTAHGITAFFYNTAVLALGINILSGLLGH